MVLPGAPRFVELGAVAPDGAPIDLDEVTQIPRELHSTGRRAVALASGDDQLGCDRRNDDDDEPEAGAAVSAA